MMGTSLMEQIPPASLAKAKLQKLQRRRQAQIRKIAKNHGQISVLIDKSKFLLTLITYCENAGDWKNRDELVEKMTESMAELVANIQKSSEQAEKLSQHADLYQMAEDSFKGLVPSISRD